jgi:hypothetical protein
MSDLQEIPGLLEGPAEECCQVKCCKVIDRVDGVASSECRIR